MKTIIIGIAGGTGSGKSTFTRKLKKEFKDDVAVLYHDNYYRDQSDIPLEERRKTNYDHLLWYTKVVTFRSDKIE